MPRDDEYLLDILEAARLPKRMWPTEPRPNL